MNGKREKTNAHGGRILSYEPLKVHCDACDQDFNSWESFGRHMDKIVDKPADTRREAVMDVLADHLGDIGLEDGWDDPQVTPDGSIKCGCLAEFPDITKWRAPRHRHPQSPLPYFLLTKPAGPEAEYQLEHYVPVDISLFVCIIRNNQRKFRISTAT